MSIVTTMIDGTLLFLNDQGLATDIYARARKFDSQAEAELIARVATDTEGWSGLGIRWTARPFPTSDQSS